MRTSIITMVLVGFFGATSYAQEIEWLNDDQLIAFFKSDPNVCENYRSDETCDSIVSYKYLGNKRILSVGRSLVAGNFEFVISLVDVINQESYCVEQASVVNQDDLVKQIGENGIGNKIELIEETIRNNEACSKLQALPESDSFGNLYIQYEIVNGREVDSSSIKLIDDPDSVKLRISVDFGFKEDPFREDSWREEQ